MAKLFFLSSLFLLLLYPSLDAQKEMNNKRMEKIFREKVDMVEGETGAWLLHYQDRILLCITDEKNNRMRIFTPIQEEKNISKEELNKMLQANFHSALDAKYGLYDGYAVSLFTHPLKELSEGQLLDAMKQVSMLAGTFGTSYSSTELIFGDGMQDEKKEKKESGKEKRS